MNQLITAQINKFSYPEYSGLETSPEILYAIESLFSGSVLDEDSPAYAEWRDGYNDEQVLELAWSVADSDRDEIYWGGTHTR